jgi:EAL domain-containing protein (putative c-di-GMP-specific phosphodiesterase class I)/sensor domain CHASE-containing protein
MRARSILFGLFLLMSFPASRTATVAVGTSDVRPAVLALNELRSAWFGQLNELIATARALAVADDTYEFVKRPNIPYVDAHFDLKHLAAARIDNVLIISLHGKPLFWRRVKQGGNRGFPDARLFLAELPPLPAPGAAGVPSLAGAATLIHGPKLVVAMPIYASSGSGIARGWLIATRALDAYQWHRYEELARVPVQLLDPHDSGSTGDVEAALEQPLRPFVRVEPKQIQGFMSVPDFQGKPFRVFSVSLQRREAAAGAVAVAPLARSVPRFSLMLIIACLGIAIVASGVMRYRDRGIVWLSASTGAIAQPPSEAANSGSSSVVATPGGAGFSSAQTRDALRARLGASKAVFRYQPQIDLETGRVAGVEALLCAPGLDGFRPAIELAAEIESAGLGLALVERRLHEACREQRAWLKTVGHAFPIGVPISQRALVDAAFLPLVQTILVENELAPSFLELQVEEGALGPSVAALRSVTKVRDAGISIAIDGFNAAHSNLRLLSILPISKLRVDPHLLLRIDDGPSASLLYEGIIGAARGLGLVVCATGIDSPQLLSTVLRHGRPLAQGAALGAALAGDEFLELLQRSDVATVMLRPLDLGEYRLVQGSA